MENELLLKVWVPSLEYYRAQLQALKEIDPTPFPAPQVERWKELLVYYGTRVRQYEDLVDYLKNSERK